MNTTVNQKIEDALLEFYLEADKDTINEILQEDINDIEAYKKKRNKLLFMINAKAKKQANDASITFPLFFIVFKVFQCID